MQAQFPVRKWRAAAALIALLAGPILGMILNAAPAQAVPSADPSKEIVYVDRNGIIRVLDTQGDPLVQWFSPTGGWREIDLGDVNDDGDLEIIAIGSEGGNTKIGVFDPVIASGITDPNKKINGIPWDTLYEETFVGSPGIVVAGNFDNAIPGDEFAFSYQDTSGVTRVIVMNAASLGPNGKPTGRDWKQHVEYIDPVSGREWRFAASGNINGVGSDEIVLVDSKSSTTRFDVFDVDQGFLRIDGKNSSSDTIRKVAVGQVKTGGSDEIVEIRTTKPGNDALRVYEWDTSDGELDTIKGWAFAPQPDAVFLADLAGNGDQEILFLRSHPSEDAPRLIMLNEWGDDQKTLIDIEISLADIEGGKDDRFKIGAGGDIDGDGRDEIVIASDTRIVVFNDPHRTVGADSRTEYLLPTNNDTLKVGDLDAMGFIEGPMFGTDKNLVSAAVPTGTSGGADTVLLTNITTGQSVDYFVIQNLPPWLTVNPMFGATPANITFNFDATNLQIGVYRHTVQLSSNANVVNKPYSIEVVLTVEPATLLFQPGAAGFTYFPCEPPVNITSTMEIEVGGTVGLSFHAAILPVPELGAAGAGPLPGKITGGEIDNGVMVLYDELGNSARLNTLSPASISASDVITWPHDVPWIVEATSPDTVVPSAVTLTVNPEVLGESFDLSQAVMVFVADTRAGSPPDNVKVLPINVMCAQDVIRMPSLHR